ncbi:MAG: hypothetical protein H3C34_25560 [Caldilineaceae bacterium]|nr:hypothetical protein [Caldilineaceae bacterium]
MFGQASELAQGIGNYGERTWGREYELRRSELQRFWQFLARGRRWRLLARLLRRPVDLRTLEGAAGNGRSHYAGIQNVPLAAITGSEDREHDFDAAFHPRKAGMVDRWVSVAMARQRGVALPPVQLIRVGETYYVRDGHHRISVARALGQDSIEAEVIAWI